MNTDTIVQIATPAAGLYLGYTWADSLTEMLPVIAPAQPWLSAGLGLYIGYMLVPKIEGWLPRSQ